MPPNKPPLPSGFPPAPASGCVQIGAAAASPSIKEGVVVVVVVAVAVDDDDDVLHINV